MVQPQQPSLFPELRHAQYGVSREPAQETWSQVFARRMQSLVMGFPIHQLVAKGESGYYSQWREHNFAFLALQLFDSVFAHMSPGVGRGATREQLIADLKPLILERQPDATESHVAELVDFILNSLMNEGRGSFQNECIWLEENQTRAYPFRFSLLESFHDPDSDSFIIRASTEAIHLYLRVLDQPLEDDQIANLFILREQVRRGRIHRARREAERTMLLSLEYERYVEDMLRAVRRDVRSVDWIRDVTPRLEEAHQHVRRLIRDQGRVLAELKTELLNTENAANIEAFRDLINVLESCQQRHMELERRILGAGPAYLEEQAYQRFRGMARSPMPDLNQQVFMPALVLGEAFFEPVLDELFGIVLGPQIQKLMDLEILVDRLLREEALSEPFIDEEDLEGREPVPVSYDPIGNEAEERVTEILLSIGDQPVRLSELLALARDRGYDLEELNMVGVSLLHSFHGRSDLLGLAVSRDGVYLEDPDFEGDNLVIERRRGELAAVGEGSTNSTAEVTYGG